MKRLLLSAVALSVLLTQPALAQEEKVSVQQRGDDSITLNVDFDSAGIGYWHKMSAKDDLGVDFTIFYRGHRHSDFQSYELTPAVRHYFLPERSVSPYLYAGLLGAFSKSENENNGFDSSSETYTAGVLAGIGLEWFPIRNVSIGGHVGARAQYEKSRNTSASRSLLTTSSSGSTDEGFSVGTFNSGIRLNLFF